MAFTRFNYDDDRLKKELQQATGSGRYILNVPGNGSTPLYFDDPYIRVQGWGANLREVINGAPIDIDSDLSGRTRRLTKYCPKNKFSNNGVPYSVEKSYPEKKGCMTQQSRASHPSWMYRALPQNREYPLFINPQENTCLTFHNNLNTRLLERDHFVPKVPCLNENLNK